MKPGNRLSFRNGANSHKVFLLLKMREKRSIFMLSLFSLKGKAFFIFKFFKVATRGGTV